MKRDKNMFSKYIPVIGKQQYKVTFSLRSQYSD